MRNKTKADAVNTGSKNDISRDLTVIDYTTDDDLPQYICAFCLKEILNNLFVYNGIGACFRCKQLALRLAFAWHNHMESKYMDDWGGE